MIYQLCGFFGRVLLDRKSKSPLFPGAGGGSVVTNDWCISNLFPKSIVLNKFATVMIYSVWVEALRPSQQLFSHVGTFSWVEPALSNEDEVSCSRTQHRTPGEIRTRDLAIKSPVFYQLS